MSHVNHQIFIEIVIFRKTFYENYISAYHIILFYESKDPKEHFHFLNLDMNITKNTNITIVNLLNENSYHFISIEGTVQKNATLTTNIIDIGSKVQINRVEMETLEEGNNQLNHIYMGKNNDVIDINYHLKNEEKKSINRIEVQGVLNDHAKKHFKGTIDFISGCSESIGEENENCVLLSDTCISRSLPMLMCGEENVVGAHSVSSGKIEEDKLFYLQSRGLSKKESEKIIIQSNFGKVLENITNETLKESLYQKIESLI